MNHETPMFPYFVFVIVCVYVCFYFLHHREATTAMEIATGRLKCYACGFAVVTRRWRTSDYVAISVNQ